MIEQELSQRAVLEALEGKIEALRGSGELKEGVTIELYLWDDLALKFPREVFMAATEGEVAKAISRVAERSNGRFKIETITHSVKKRSGVLYAGVLPGSPPPEEAPQPFWRVRYSEINANKEGPHHSAIVSDIESNRDSQFYLTKEGDDFSYEGELLTTVSKDTNYYTVFDALHTLCHDGGFVTYEKLGKEVKRRIPAVRQYSQSELRKFMLTNLTDEHNGFLHYADIPVEVASGKKIIKTRRGKGIDFNNRKNS